MVGACEKSLVAQRRPELSNPDELSNQSSRGTLQAQNSTLRTNCGSTVKTDQDVGCSDRKRQGPDKGGGGEQRQEISESKLHTHTHTLKNQRVLCEDRKSSCLLLKLRITDFAYK